MKVRNKIIFMGILCCLKGAVGHAWAPTNFFRTDDFILRHAHVPQKSFLFGMHVETGSRSTGLDASSTRRNVLAIHDQTQSVVSMLLNSLNPSKLPVTQDPAESTGIILSGMNIVDSQDPAVGRVNFFGDYDQTDLSFFGKYGFLMSFIPGTFNVSLYVPYKHKEISNFRFEDLTKPFGAGGGGLVLQRQVIGNLIQNVKSYGDLNLRDWRCSGLGDSLLFLEWNKTFMYEHSQKKRRQKEGFSAELDHLNVFAKIGFLIPTSKSGHEDDAFSISLGHDDTWGVPGNVGLDVLFNQYLHFGIAIDYLFLFDKSKIRRMKTNKHQTEFLLLNKGKATKRHGLIWRLSTYAQVFEFFKRWFFRVSYQYIKHQDDRLIPGDTRFKEDIINTAGSLKEWNAHSLGFHVEYSPEKSGGDSRFLPELSFYYKFPLTGDSVIDMHTFGFQITLSF